MFVPRFWLGVVVVSVAGIDGGRPAAGQADFAVLDHSTIDCPGAVGTGLSGISDAGRIVGGYLTNDLAFHGMILGAGGACQPIDYPGAAATFASGINNAGQVAGWYIKLNDTLESRAFIWSNGVFEDVLPAVLPPGYSTLCAVSAGNINNQGQLAGFVEVATVTCDNGRDIGFIRQPNGTFDYPPGPYGPAYGYELADVSDNGWAVGMGFSPTSGPEVAIMRSPLGAWQADVAYASSPGCSIIKTQFTGVNPRGEAIGDYTCAEDPPYLGNDFLNGRAFFRDRTGGLSPLTVPGAARTLVIRTNASGVFVGVWFDEDDAMHGFVGSLNLVQNSAFDSGTTHWLQFATPDMSYMVSQVTGGVFEYYRVPPPPGTINQAVIFQETGAPMVSSAPLVARFRAGNSSSVRKRISVLVLDSDFTDLSVCTFWLEPNTPLSAYQMRTHSTKAWANAAIYFYAASAGANGGFYQLDDVSLNYAWAGPTSETRCVDPTAPAPPGGPAGEDMIDNGDFNTGSLTPWGTFGQIAFQIAGGVFEFIKLDGSPSGVVLQTTGQTTEADEILTATFQLGNSSTVRKRVTVIVHDYDFTDLSACTFWLAPGQPLSDYTYRTFATRAWADATLSVYPATLGAEQWIRLDNATLRRTPGTATVGTECVEPGTGGVAAITSMSRAPLRTRSAATGRKAAPVAARVGPRATLDLTAATSATLTLRSWLVLSGAWAEVQVRGADGEWTTVDVVVGSDEGISIVIDLAPYLGQIVDVRVLVHGP